MLHAVLGEREGTNVLKIAEPVQHVPKCFSQVMNDRTVK